VVEKGFEFDFTVAKNVGVRGSACFVFREKVLEYVVPVILCEINSM